MLACSLSLKTVTIQLSHDVKILATRTTDIGYYHASRQCYDLPVQTKSQDSSALEFILPRSQSRDLSTKVLVLVSRSWCQGLVLVSRPSCQDLGLGLETLVPDMVLVSRPQERS